jgi:phytoene dehydrogenase-like protein
MERYMEKSVIIIGAGIAGLSAGIYGRANGYKTMIYELHDKPGGLCTSWKREGYTFDGCISWLVGSAPGGVMNRMWQELGALCDTKIIDHDEFIRVENREGKQFVLYTNIDRLEHHLKELSPDDAAYTEKLTKLLNKFVSFCGAAGDMYEERGVLSKVGAGIKMMPFLRNLMKYSKISIKEFANGFKDPFLRDAFEHCFGLPDFPIMGLFMTIAWMNNRDAGYPVGGSLEFSRRIEKRYLDLGGEIHYKSTVSKVLVENGRAVGIRLKDGTERRADYIISAADGHATIFDMLEGKYANEQIKGWYRDLPLFRGMVQVSIGVKRDLSKEPPMLLFPLEEPFEVSGEKRERMGYHHFCYDPTMAQKGKSVVIVGFDSDYEYWQKLSEDRNAYDSEKQKIADTVIQVLDGRFSGFKEDVEAVDVATPLTTQRYTGNWKGSVEGWLITKETMKMMFGKGMPKTLPDLDNFFMAGQWVEPGGGLPPSAQSGRKVIGMICKKDGKRFTAPQEQ